jgi:acyl-CoA synthetase (AMP-forming)/AMP-acid ligase II
MHQQRILQAKHVADVDSAHAHTSHAVYAGCFLQAAKGTDNKVMSFSELQELGRKKVAAPEPPKPSDLSTIMYTSGTTGALLAGSGHVLCSSTAHSMATDVSLQLLCLPSASHCPAASLQQQQQQ